MIILTFFYIYGSKCGAHTPTLVFSFFFTFCCLAMLFYVCLAGRKNVQKNQKNTLQNVGPLNLGAVVGQTF